MMDFDFKTLGLWIVIWLVGYGLGLLEAKIKNDSKEKQEKTDLDTVIDDALNEGLPRSVPASNPNEKEILTVFERISGAFKIRIDGETVEYKPDLDAEKRARLVNIVIAMRPWLEEPAEAKKAPVAPSVAQATVPVQTVNPPPPPTLHKVTEPARNPEFVIDTKLEEITSSKLTMVEQIDRILQKKLTGSPLEDRGILLRTALNGSLLIKVGLKEYEWIDDIPEQPIQDIIRAAIAEWENATG